MPVMMFQAIKQIKKQIARTLAHCCQSLPIHTSSLQRPIQWLLRYGARFVSPHQTHRLCVLLSIATAPIRTQSNNNKMALMPWSTKYETHVIQCNSARGVACSDC